MCRGGNRTLAQLKSQWGIIKMSQKKLKAAERKQTFMTGGGPPPQRNPGDSLGDISAWLPNEFTIDDNEFDSDQISQIKVGTATTSTNIEVYDTVIIVDQKDDDATMKNEDRENIIEIAISNNGNHPDPPSHTPSKMPRRKEENDNKDPKKSAVKDTAQTPRRKEGNYNRATSFAASIADNEIRCRSELHQAQMQNEARKTNILTLKEELIRKKIEYYEKKTKMAEK